MKLQFIVSLALSLTASASPALLKREGDGPTPSGPVDEGISPDCVYYQTALDKTWDCSKIAKTWKMAPAQLYRLVGSPLL